MEIKNKRCSNCKRWFKPNPTTIERDGSNLIIRQKYCLDPPCRKAGKKEAQRLWLDKNPAYYKGDGRKTKVRIWAKDYPDYWKHWRLNHEGYVERNRKKQKQRDQRRRFLAKQDLIAQNPLERLDGIRLLTQNNLAKQDLIRLPIEGILDFLVLKESLAKQETIDLPAFKSG